MLCLVCHVTKSHDFGVLYLKLVAMVTWSVFNNDDGDITTGLHISITVITFHINFDHLIVNICCSVTIMCLAGIFSQNFVIMILFFCIKNATFIHVL